MNAQRKHDSNCSTLNLFTIYIQKNILLNKMGLVTTNNCLWWSEVDYTEHAFYQCAKLKEFCKNIRQQILIKYNKRVEIDEKVTLFGASKTERENAEIRKKVNHIRLIA